MPNREPSPIDIQAALQDLADYDRFFASAEKSSRKLSEDDLDMFSAAGNYAAFMQKFGLSEEDESEQ